VTYRPSDHRIAVIDIGSNSVRLVVFEGGGRFPAIAFNEKVMCGLGRTVAATRRLDPEGMVLALQTLDRFALLLREMRIKEVRAVATAAMRDAENGRAFVDAIETRCGFPVDLLSGGEEGRYSAMGVLAGIPEADGIVGDLGGGSLELVDIRQGAIGNAVSLPLGPLLLMDEFAKKRAAAIARIAETLQQAPWLGEGKGRDFYAVGGAWRALARLHLERGNYPLHILHHYEMDRAEVMEFCGVLAGMSAQSLVKAPRIAQRRLESLPMAAAVMRRIFELSGCRRLVISALGLREGLVYAAMPEELRKVDPLLDACGDIARRSGRFAEHADKLLEWTAPLFANESAADKRLRHAAALLSDVAWQGHPDYRAEKVLSEVLYGRFGGIDHRGAAKVALALYVAYGGTLGEGIAGDVERLLNNGDRNWSRTLGLGLRLAQRISGGTSSALRFARLEMSADTLFLKVQEPRQAIAGEVVCRRLDALAKAVGRKSAVLPE
jgi:exopolyphosphatase/guanosine-5'-triphosphate,3'-diphosphate pyrophosphatase